MNRRVQNFSDVGVRAVKSKTFNTFKLNEKWPIKNETNFAMFVLHHFDTNGVQYGFSVVPQIT